MNGARDKMDAKINTCKHKLIQQEAEKTYLAKDCFLQCLDAPSDEKLNRLCLMTKKTLMQPTWIEKSIVKCITDMRLSLKSLECSSKS